MKPISNDLLLHLTQADDPVHWEYPGGYSAYRYEEKERNFRAFSEALRQLFSVPVKVESFPQIQDASFHGNICFTHPEHAEVTLRVSKFGNLFTLWMWSKEDIDLSLSPSDPIIRLAEQFGYTYIPKEVLRHEYTGENPGVTGIRTWWDRYFDYV